MTMSELATVIEQMPSTSEAQSFIDEHLFEDAFYDNKKDF